MKLLPKETFLRCQLIQQQHKLRFVHLELSEHFDESWPNVPRSVCEVASEHQRGGQKYPREEMTWTLEMENIFDRKLFFKGRESNTDIKRSRK